MPCIPGCRCSCQQTACGCTTRTSVATPDEPPSLGPLATCRMCRRKARAQVLPSPLGVKVTAILCGRCDRRGGR